MEQRTKLAEEVVKAVMGHIESVYKEEGTARLGRLTVTDLCRCLRQAKYKLMGVAQTDTPPSIGALHDGKMYHTDLQRMFWTLFSGAFTDCEMEVALPNGIKGHIDGILTIGQSRFLVEFKTVNQWGWKSRVPLEEGYRRQVNTYMGALGIERALVVFRRKEYFDMDAIEVWFDPALYDATLTDSERILAAASAEEFARIPVEDKGALNWKCCYCPYLQKCWDGTVEQTATNKWRVKR